jgi:hypothetical protein
MQGEQQPMSIANYAVAEAAIAQVEAATAKNKVPPKRQAVALADAIATPEPR